MRFRNSIRIASLLAGAALLTAQPPPISSLGAITGHVLGPDGQPMQEVAVSAIGSDGETVSMESEPDGYYRLYYLHPGGYRVKATPRAVQLPPEIRTDGTAEVRYATTYYPSSLPSETEATVEVDAGGERAGIDIKMLPTPIVAVRGVVSGAPDGAGVLARKVLPRRAPDTGRGGPLFEVAFQHRVNSDGTFVIWGLDPGTYTLTAGRSAPVTIEVKDKDVGGVKLTVVARIDVAGQVVPVDDGARIPPSMPGIVPARPPQIALITADGLPGGGLSVLGPDGSFHFDNVAPGKYYVELWSGAYTQSLRIGEATTPGPTLDVSNGYRGGPLTVMAGSATGRVTGAITNTAPGARTIVRMTSEDSPAYDRGATARRDGSFTIADVPPGRYKIFVLDPGINIFYRDQAAAYADIAVAIEVHTGDRLTQDLRQHPK